MNLLTKARKKLQSTNYEMSEGAKQRYKSHTSSSKIVRRISTLTLAAVMAWCLFTFNACGNRTDEGGGNPPTEQTDPTLSQYSSILQTVLTNEYYNSIIDRRLATGVIHYLAAPDFYPHPYAFLAKQGHDVSKIKTLQLDCTTSIYTKDDNTNKLYMSVLMESENKEYYTNYVLSCDLTKKEYSDLVMLYSNNYAQAPLLIQELANQKTINIESCVNVSKKLQTELLSKCKSWKILKEALGTTNIEIDFTEVSATNKTINLTVRKKPTGNNMIITNFKLCNLILETFTLSDHNNIYQAADLGIKAILNETELKNSSASINYFHLGDNTTSKKVEYSK